MIKYVDRGIKRKTESNKRGLGYILQDSNDNIEDGCSHLREDTVIRNVIIVLQMLVTKWN